MKLRTLLALIACSCLTPRAAHDAPPLPLTGQRVVRISTEPQLQTAVNNLRQGDTLLLAPGLYSLTASLYINGRHQVTIRGESGRTNVVLRGKGMDNAAHGGVPHGIWSNSSNTTIAHLTIRETYDNPIIFNSGAQAPLIYSVALIDAGSQFIKSNPTDIAEGRGVNDGRVERCWFEYTGRPPSDHGAGAGYFNGISAHAARNWVVRGNTFKNLHNPDGTPYPWNPAVLFWRNSSHTVTEQNTFINVDRAIAYGLDDSTTFHDHSGGAIRNNFIYLEPGFFSAARRASADGAIVVWNSPGTEVDHNTVITSQNTAASIEFRFRRTTNVVARNNLTDAPIRIRDQAQPAQSGNLVNAQPSLFVDPTQGDLHLKSGAASAIDRATPLTTITNDIDGELRPAETPDLGADEFTARIPPLIRRLTLEDGEARLLFDTQATPAYEVETAESLTGAWQIASPLLPGTGGQYDYLASEPATDPRRFYRLRLWP